LGPKRKCFALVHTWPELRNAEYEVVQRIAAAAANIGASIVIIDNSGLIIWASPDLNMTARSCLREADVEFLLSLHFLSPRLLDIYSYITLWQPIQFYHQFGYQSSIESVASHNDLISCGSDLADGHGVNLLAGVGRAPIGPLPKMFHAVAQPYLKPNVTEDSRLFYIGINWEKLGRPKGRFHDTLIYLDSEDLTDIYGPQLLHGESVWGDFSTYRGELPFDGESVKYAAGRAGICLALSSAEHSHAGIMSNRLFEGLAGGAAVIATPNPLITKYFSDAVYLVDDTKGDEILGQQIVATLRRIRAEPDEANERVARGQEILRNHCSLELSLETLFSVTAERANIRRQRSLATSEITIIMVHLGNSTDKLADKIDELSAQLGVNVILHVVCSESFFQKYNDSFSEWAKGSIKSIQLHNVPLYPTPKTFDGYAPPRDRMGIVINRLLSMIETPYFAFLRADEHVFSEHYSTVIKAIESHPGAKLGCSGSIAEKLDSLGNRARALDSLKFSDLNSILVANPSTQPGRFVFSKSLVTGASEIVVPLLDGEESTYFQLMGLLDGPLAQTSYATYVLREYEGAMVPLPVEPIDYQLQYIRDAVSGDGRWLDQITRYGKKPEFIYAFSPGAPPRWDQSPPQAPPPMLALDTPALFGSDSPAIRYLAAGFSHPEPDHVWIEGSYGLIEFSIPRNDDDPFGLQRATLRIRAVGRRSAAGREQHCTLTLNGETIAYFGVPEAETELVVPLPQRIIDRTHHFRIQLTPDHREAVTDVNGTVIDPRLLSIQLKSIIIDTAGEKEIPLLEFDKTYALGGGSYGAAVLYRNFYPGEATGVWMVGRQGALRFRVGPHEGGVSIELTVAGRKALKTGESQTLRMTLNGESLPSITLSDGENTIRVPVPALNTLDGLVTLNLELDHAEAVMDDQWKIIDPRLLGLFLLSLTIVRSKGAANPPRAGDSNGISKRRGALGAVLQRVIAASK
jgi:hypothetical protein